MSTRNDNTTALDQLEHIKRDMDAYPELRSWSVRLGAAISALKGERKLDTFIGGTD